MLFELLKKEFATSTILYVGYSNRDPNWQTVLSEITSEFYPSKTPNSYRVVPNTDPIDNEILKSKNIETIEASYKAFAEAAMISVSVEKGDPNRIRRLRSSIPTDLLPAFEESPAAVARLLSSWTYVNQAKFDDRPNVHAFLRGDRPREQYLAFAETMAQQHKLMYMTDWINKLDDILLLNGRELLAHAGKISHEMAVEKSNQEFEKYKEELKQIARVHNLKEIEEDIKQLIQTTKHTKSTKK